MAFRDCFAIVIPVGTSAMARQFSKRSACQEWTRFPIPMKGNRGSPGNGYRMPHSAPLSGMPGWLVLRHLLLLRLDFALGVLLVSLFPWEAICSSQPVP